MPVPEQPSNVPRQPVHGEKQEMESIEQAQNPSPQKPGPEPRPDINAPEPRPEGAQVPEVPEREDREGVPQNTGDMITFTPPEVPTNTPIQPLDAEEAVAYAVAGMRGVSPIVQRLAGQLLGGVGRGRTAEGPPERREMPEQAQGSTGSPTERGL